MPAGSAAGSLPEGSRAARSQVQTAGSRICQPAQGAAGRHLEQDRPPVPRLGGRLCRGQQHPLGAHACGSAAISAYRAIRAAASKTQVRRKRPPASPTRSASAATKGVSRKEDGLQRLQRTAPQGFPRQIGFAPASRPGQGECGQAEGRGDRARKRPQSQVAFPISQSVELFLPFFVLIGDRWMVPSVAAARD